MLTYPASHIAGTGAVAPLGVGFIHDHGDGAHQVIGYCPRHASELEPYLERRRQDIRETRRSNESLWPPVGIRDRLTARRQE